MFGDRVAQIARITAGSSLLLAGVAMLVLPGPGIFAILAALALLERDLPIARELLAKLRARLGQRQPEPVRIRIESPPSLP